MSASASDSGAPIRIVGGRQPSPYSKAPVWLLFAGLSPQARALYDILAAHLNPGRDDQVWPTRETLAELLCMKQARSVDPYINELEAVGAIDVIRQKAPGRMTDKNVYVVHHEPPDSYTGPRSTREYYDRKKRITAGEDVVRSTAPLPDQDKQPKSPAVNMPKAGEPSITAGHPVVRSSAQRSAVQRRPVVRSGALKEEQGKYNKPLPPTPPHAASLAPAATPQEGEEDPPRAKTSNPHTDTLIAEIRAIRREWSTTAIRRALKHPDVTERDPALVRQAMLLIAADETTKLPGRLAMDGPWWADAANTMRSLARPSGGDSRPSDRPLALALACPSHPGTTRRANGQCAGCWQDELGVGA